NIRLRPRRSPNSRRKFILKYFCPDQDGNNQEVCKVFFMSTLGYNKKCDKRLRTVVKNTNDDDLQATPDFRDRHIPHNKIDKTRIVNHINSFRPSISHYRRERALNRKYLPTDLNVQIMFKCFKSANKDFICSYEHYRKTVQEMNISFVKLNHEECFACKQYFLHEKNSLYKRDDPKSDCPVLKQKLTKLANTMLMTKTTPVIMLPRYESLKEVIFTGRITAFNESSVPVGTKQRNKNAIAVIWHEGAAGRSKYDIISTFHSFFLRYRDDKHIILWLDNCLAQNKNWTLLAFFVNIVNSNICNVQKFEIKYFEPGHTFMSADLFHHQVEMSLKRQQKVFDFADFEEC
ncbi:hypothetical protein RN001_002035, partial [Aquatica leii]